MKKEDIVFKLIELITHYIKSLLEIKKFGSFIASHLLLVLSYTFSVIKSDDLLILLILLNLFWIYSIQCAKGATCKVKNETEWWSLSGWEFEEECAKVLRKSGYTNVQVTKKTGDDGVDLIFFKGDTKLIAQAKHYKSKVTPEPVRALYGVKNDFSADIVVMIASSGVTKSGEKFIANKKDYWLWTLTDIISMNK